jgi:LacI family transcriptional regulator
MARLARRKSTGVTIQSVAEHAGVSTMTVSNVVNGTGKMSQRTREAVLTAIRDLGYSPNVAARDLASAGAMRIGMIYYNPQNAFLSAMLVGALNATSARGVQLMLRACPELTFKAAEAQLRTLVRSGANALLLAPPFCEMINGTPLVRELGVPVAAVAPGQMLPDMVSFRVDDRAAANAMTALLIGKGHKRIGFVAGPSYHSASAPRIEGYRDALREHAYPFDPSLITAGDFSFESGLSAAETLLSLPQPPTAIFASNDDMAAAIVSIAHRRHLDVPRDLAVTGFDDTPIAIKIWPPLTTVRQPITAMSEQAANAVIDVLRRSDETQTAHGETLLPYEIIERDST